MLADGLHRRGWDVTVCGHSSLPKDNCDLIHVHHFGRAALRLAGALHQQPLVLTTHDPFAMNGLPVGWKRRLTDDFVLKRVDAVVALSNAERDFLIRKGVSSSRIAVIPNGVDPDVFDRRGTVPDSAREELLFVGQLQPFKGLHDLLEALPAVRRAFPNVTLRVVYQTDALLGHYRNQAARLGLGDVVDFAGPKTAAELAGLYASAAVVVSPSLGECLSTVVLEAMCCGAAVIATDVGGIREQLDEETGVIVPPRDPVAMARAISELLADDQARQALGQAARRKARAQFNARLMVDRHVRLYEALLNTNERAA